MYIRITSRCNMRCLHCCYSCRPGAGMHAPFDQVIDMLAFAREQGHDSIALGGGEPTMHPRFFDILRIALQDFDYVWFATNGSKYKTMRRLVDIIEGNDFDNFSEHDDRLAIYQEGKLGVALSTDYYHDHGMVHEWVRSTWTRMANNNRSGFEVRDVTRNHDGVSATGRAKRTGVGWSEHCVCSSIIIEPDGRLKLCGCTKAPIIGHINTGIEKKWYRVINSTNFSDYGCYTDWRNGTKGGRNG